MHNYCLRQEKSAQCMVPPPFNALAVLAYPVYYYAMSACGVSLCGTLSNVILR